MDSTAIPVATPADKADATAESEPRTDPMLTSCVCCGASSPLVSAYTLQKAAKWKGGKTCPACTESLAVENARKILKGMLGLTMGAMGLLLFSDGSTGWLFLNYCLALWLGIILIVPHELCHAQAALSAGGRVYAIVLGRGRIVGSLMFQGMLIQLRAVPTMGLTYVQMKPGPGYHRHAMFVTAAGPLFHVVMLLIFGWALDSSWRGESPSSALAPLLAFNLANLILLFRNLNLWDRSGFVTDGARLWGYITRRTTPENQVLVMAATACTGAALHLQSGSWQQAKQITEQALAQAPDHQGLRLLHATSAGESGNPGQAVQELREMLRTPPAEAGGDAAAQNNLAWYLMASGQEVDGAEVLRLAEAASRLLPWDLGCKSTLGAAQALYGDPQGALGLLDENKFLLCPSSDRASVAAARAIALHRTGQKREALACLQRAEQRASTHPMVQRARILLAQEGG